VRTIFFWAHLTAGTIAAVVIFIMSLSGVLLTYERQMIARADRGFRALPPRDGASRMGAQLLLAELQKYEDSRPAALTIHSAPSAPAEAAFGRRIVYLDTYSGRVLGESSATMRRFFQAVTEWHRYIGREGESRLIGRAITGACNLAFLLLVMSGTYLWLPRVWTWRTVRAVLWFRGGLKGKARDFNWHNAVGIWSAVPLLFVIIGALVISYPWATNLLYVVTGSAPPAAPPAAEPVSGDLTFATLNAAWALAEAEMPEWQSIILRLPEPGRPVYGFTIAASHRGRPDKRMSLTIHQQSVDVIHRERFDDLSLGRKLRLYLRFVHTGEIFGIAGQTVAGVVSAGGALLAFTGLALSWRRFTGWRLRRSRTPGMRDGTPSI
jgi:uncharacterized iron-regulated membrane protein